MKYFKILIFATLSIYVANKGYERFRIRDNDAGFAYYIAATSLGIAAIIFAIQVYQEKIQENKKK